MTQSGTHGILNAETYPATVTGTQAMWGKAPAPVDLFGWQKEGKESRIECKEGSEFSMGSLAGPQSEFDLNPTYSHCEAFSGGVTVAMHSCKYRFLPPAYSGEYTGEFELFCSTPGDEVVLQYPCSIHIPAQTFDTDIIQYHNEGSGSTRRVLLDAWVTDVEFTTSGGFACGLFGLPKSGGTGTFGALLYLTGSA